MISRGGQTPLAAAAALRRGWVVSGAGLLVLALGVSTLAGWLLELRSLVDPWPGSGVLQPGLGVTLVLAGASLLLSVAGRWGPARILAALALMPCLGAMAHELLGWETPLTHMRGRLAPAMAPLPGPMSLNAAIGLGLASIGLLLARRRLVFAAMAASASAVIGLATLLGRATGLESLSHWSAGGEMTVPAALALLLLSLGLFMHTATRGERHPAFIEWRNAAVAAVAVALTTLLFSNALVAREHRQLLASLDSVAEHVVTELRTSIAVRQVALALIATDWVFFMQDADDEHWVADASLLASQFPEFEALVWLQPDARVRRSYPPGRVADWGPAEDLPREGRGAVLLGPPESPGGARDLRFVLPLRIDGVERGWLASLFRAPALLGNLALEVGLEYALAVTAEGVTLFGGAQPAAELPRSWVAARSFDVPGSGHWQVALRPTRELLVRNETMLPWTVLAGGLVLAGVLAIALHLQAVATARERALDEANRALAIEIKGHRAAEEQLRSLSSELEQRVSHRTAELARRNQELQDFGSFLSHELRQPIGALTLASDLLAVACAEALDERGRRLVQQVQAAAGRLAALVQGQLTLSAISSRPAPDEMIDLDQVVRDVCTDLKSEIERAGARVRIGKLPTMRADRLQMYQLFRNLIENSIKYRRDDAALEVEIAYSRPEDGVVCCRIVLSDNGSGFGPEDAERIFAVSKRLHPEVGSGSGMGLAICRRIIEVHGGTIVASGEPGRGATFRIDFPTGRCASGPPDGGPKPGASA